MAFDPSPGETVFLKLSPADRATVSKLMDCLKARLGRDVRPYEAILDAIRQAVALPEAATA